LSRLFFWNTGSKGSMGSMCSKGWKHFPFLALKNYSKEQWVQVRVEDLLPSPFWGRVGEEGQKV
jgi:hypothetical protein